MLSVCPTCSCRGSSECQDRWHEANGLAMPGQYDKPHPGAVARRSYRMVCPTCHAPPGAQCEGIFIGGPHDARLKAARSAMLAEEGEDVMAKVYDAMTMFNEWRARCSRLGEPVPPPWEELPTAPIDVQEVWRTAARMRTEKERREKEARR